MSRQQKNSFDDSDNGKNKQSSGMKEKERIFNERVKLMEEKNRILAANAEQKRLEEDLYRSGRDLYSWDEQLDFGGYENRGKPPLPRKLTSQSPTSSPSLSGRSPLSSSPSSSPLLTEKGSSKLPSRVDMLKSQLGFNKGFSVLDKAKTKDPDTAKVPLTKIKPKDINNETTPTRPSTSISTNPSISSMEKESNDLITFDFEPEDDWLRKKHPTNPFLNEMNKEELYKFHTQNENLDKGESFSFSDLHSQLRNELSQHEAEVLKQQEAMRTRRNRDDFAFEEDSDFRLAMQLQQNEVADLYNKYLEKKSVDNKLNEKYKPIYPDEQDRRASFHHQVSMNTTAHHHKPPTPNKPSRSTTSTYSSSIHTSTSRTSESSTTAERGNFFLTVDQLRSTATKIVDMAIKRAFSYSPLYSYQQEGSSLYGSNHQRHLEVNAVKRNKIINTVYQSMLIGGVCAYRFTSKGQMERFITECSKIIQPGFTIAPNNPYHVSIDMHEIVFDQWVKNDCLKRQYIQLGIQSLLSKF